MVVIIKAAGAVSVDIERMKIHDVRRVLAAAAFDNIRVGIGDEDRLVVIEITVGITVVRYHSPSGDGMTAAAGCGAFSLDDHAETAAVARLDVIQEHFQIGAGVKPSLCRHHIKCIVAQITAGIGIVKNLCRYRAGIARHGGMVEEPCETVIGVAAVIAVGIGKELHHLILILEACLLCPARIGEEIRRRGRPAKIAVRIIETHLFRVDKAKVGHVKRLTADVGLNDLILYLFNIIRGQSGKINCLGGIGNVKLHVVIPADCMILTDRHDLLAACHQCIFVVQLIGIRNTG